jgi:hypothetical protein
MGVNKICMWMCFVHILSDFKSKADSKGNNNMTKTVTDSEDSKYHLQNYLIFNFNCTFLS